MSIFKKNRKENIMKKKKISVDDLGYLIKNHPESIATYPPKNEYLEQRKKYFDSEPNNINKKKILSLSVGDVMINAVGAKWYVAEITPYEIILNDYGSKSHVSTLSKWDFYLMLKSNVPIRFK